MKNKSSMGQALRNMRGGGVDVAVIVNGQPEEQEDVQEKVLGLAPDAERLEGTPLDGEELVEPSGNAEDLGALLANDRPLDFRRLAARSAMKKGM